MNAPHDLNDREIGELDDLLATVPEPHEALDVVMLDGYLCGVLAQPTLIDESQWLPPALDWNFGEGTAAVSADTPGWHHAKHERLLALVRRRHAALERALREDGWFDPLVMAPQDDSGKPLQGRAAIDGVIQETLAPWVIGFEHALNHFDALEALSHDELPDLLACVWRHLPEQTEEERAYTQALDAEHPLKSLDAAIEDLVHNVVAIADIAREARLKVATVRREQPKVGRNDPCPCGSGKKYKACHGRSA